MKWLTFSSTNQNLLFHFLLLVMLIIKTVWQAFVFNAEYFFVGENQEQGSSDLPVPSCFALKCLKVLLFIIRDGPWIPYQQQMKNVSQQTDQREKIKKYKPWRKYPSSSQTIRAWRTRAIWTFPTLFSDISHSTIQSYHRWSLLVKPLSKLIIKQKLLQLRLQLIVDLLRWVRI